jgi:hypothetical protein
MKKSFLLVVGLIALYNLFFFRSQIGIGLGVIFLILNTTYYLSRDKQAKNTNLGLISAVLSTTFAILISFRNNGVVQFLDFLAASFFSTIALSFFKNPNTFSYFVPSFLSIPLNMVLNYFISLGSLFRTENTEEKKNENKSLIGSVIRGFLMTIPIFIILLFLLVQADPAFNKLVSDLIKDLWQRLIFSVLILIAIYPTLQIKLKEKIDEKIEQSIENFSHKSYELMIITGSLIILFGSFIIVQFQYLFSNVGERELQKLGINSLTYSEYINKGFFELLIVSAIACLILIYNLRHLHKLTGLHETLTQVFTSILTIETFLIILSDFKRIMLYADAHGLTRARIFGFIFLVWLTLILVLFLISILKQLPKKAFFMTSTAMTIIILLSLSIINIDSLIATKFKPTVNNELDYYYISHLSTDASGGWIEAVKESKATIEELSLKKDLNTEEQRRGYWASETLLTLNYRISYLKYKYGSEQDLINYLTKELNRTPQEIIITEYYKAKRDWTNFNWSEYQTYRLIKETPTLNTLSDYQPKVQSLHQSINKYNNYYPLDRSTSPPLTK